MITKALTKAQKELLEIIKKHPEGYTAKPNYRPLKALLERGLVVFDEVKVVAKK